ncbi:MAG: peptidoglycan editing factor PgeF [Acidobacteria bacterium]|nr:MAG: peptidoglycan editing factor PgeF [Acidobacteriota bacterium]
MSVHYYGGVPTQAAKNLRKTLAVEILRAQNLNRVPWLVHGFSTRRGGVSSAYRGNSLNLGFTRTDKHSNVETNRARLLQSIAAYGADRKLWPLVTLRQVHSDIIHRVSAVPEKNLAGDGMVTNTANLLLGIQTADCLPIILVDKKRHTLGVFHAGWRGTVKRIVEKGLGEMRRYFGTHPKDVQAAIGPGIHSCCYQVGEEVRIKFESQFEYGAELFRETKESDEIHERYPLLFLTARAPGHSELPTKLFLDLVEANRRQLLAAGVPGKNIHASELCTSCRSDLLFSHRADKGVTGRMMGVAGIREVR